MLVLASANQGMPEAIYLLRILTNSARICNHCNISCAVLSYNCLPTYDECLTSCMSKVHFYRLNQVHVGTNKEKQR